MKFEFWKKIRLQEHKYHHFFIWVKRMTRAILPCNTPSPKGISRTLMDKCKRKWEWDAAVCGHVHYKWHVMWTQWSLCEVSVSIVISYIGPGLSSITPQHLDHGGSRRRHSIACSRSKDSKVRQSDSASMFLCHFHLLDRGSGALRQMRPYNLGTNFLYLAASIS